MAMRLTYLPANRAWVFTMGTELVRMGEGTMFHSTRRDAVDAANRQGLAVVRRDVVTLDCRDCYGTCSNDVASVFCGLSHPARVCGRHALDGLGHPSIAANAAYRIANTEGLK